MKGDFKPDSIWFGKSTDVPARDNLSGGSLKSNDVFSHVLLMKMRDEDHLVSYQQENFHSDIRTEFYAGLDAKIRNLYHMMPAEGLGERGHIFEIIEELVGKFFQRMYFVECLPVANIVKMKPYTFHY